MSEEATQDPADAAALQPILTHETSLAAKVAKGSEARKVLDEQVLQLGSQLVTNLHILFKTTKIHDRTNRALNQSVEAVQTLVKTLAREGRTVLRLQNDFLFLGEMHLKTTPQQFTLFMEFIESLNARQIGSLSFDADLKESALREFAHLFVTVDPTTSSADDLKQQMREHGVTGIEIERHRQLKLKAGEKHEQGRLLAKISYVKAAEAAAEVTQSVGQGRAPSFKRAKRVMQNIIELMGQDEGLMLGMTTLRCYDQYTHNHSVNVSLLAISLGNRIGFSKVALADLGLAALFHDVGKASIPLEVLNKPNELTEADWAQIRSHPTEGVVSMVRLRGLDHLPGRMASASFEHHMNTDFSGYPKLANPWNISLTGRILMIADCYDAMTSSRVYRREAMSPEKVLKFMLGKSGTSFDPVLLKLFVNCVGFIPIGSLVLLDSNELAVVVKPARNPKEMDRPIVKLVTDSSGNPIEGQEADLTETDEKGKHKRSVVQIVDNTAYGFDTSRFLV